MNPLFEQTQEVTQLWADFATKMFAAAMASAKPNGSPTPDAAREVRGAMFRAMAESTDQFMRSPTFLDSVKQYLANSVAMRKQWNDALTELHHSVEGVARRDLDAVILSVRQLESRTLDRLDAMDEQLARAVTLLESLESRLDGAAAKRSAPSGGAGEGSTPKQARREHV
jgi:hypothetical protein